MNLTETTYRRAAKRLARLKARCSSTWEWESQFVESGGESCTVAERIFFEMFPTDGHDCGDAREFWEEHLGYGDPLDEEVLEFVEKTIAALSQVQTS